MFFSSHLFATVIFLVICATSSVSNLRNEISLSNDENEISVEEDYDYKEVENYGEYEAQQYEKSITTTTTVGTTTPMGECCACPTTPTTTTTTTTTQRPTVPTQPTQPTPTTPTTPTIPTIPTVPTTPTTTQRPIIITCPAGQCAVCMPCPRFKNRIENKNKFYNGVTRNSSIFMNIKNGKYLEF